MKQVRKKHKKSSEDGENSELSLAMSKIEMIEKGLCFNCKRKKKEHKSTEC